MRILLHRLRPASPQAGADPSVLAVLRLAALSAAHRQSGRRPGLPHEAARRREQGAGEQALCRRAAAAPAGNPAGRAPAAADRGPAQCAGDGTGRAVAGVQSGLYPTFTTSIKLAPTLSAVPAKL